MVRMPLQDCKCTVDLFEKNHAGQLMGEGHFSEGKNQVGGAAGLVAETVGGTDGENQVLGAAVLLVAKQLSELFGSELAPAGIEQDHDRRGAPRGAIGELQQR